MLLLFDTLCNFNNFMHIYNLFSGNQITSFFFSNCKASCSSESADVIKLKKYDFNIIEHLKLVSKCYSWCCVNCQNINSFCLICYHLTDGIHVQASKRPQMSIKYVCLRVELQAKNAEVVIFLEYPYLSVRELVKSGAVKR